MLFIPFKLTVQWTVVFVQKNNGKTWEIIRPVVMRFWYIFHSGFNSMKLNIWMSSTQLSAWVLTSWEHLLWNFSGNAVSYSRSANINKSASVELFSTTLSVKATRTCIKIRQPQFLYSKKALLIFLWLSANWVTQCKAASSHLSERGLAVQNAHMYMYTHNYIHCGSISIVKWLVTFYQG